MIGCRMSRARLPHPAMLAVLLAASCALAHRARRVAAAYGVANLLPKKATMLDYYPFWSGIIFLRKNQK